MDVAERGPRRTGHGVAWLIGMLVPLAGLWVSSFLSALAPLGYLIFGVLLAMFALKAYAAFSGVRRFGPNPRSQTR